MSLGGEPEDAHRVRRYTPRVRVAWLLVSSVALAAPPKPVRKPPPPNLDADKIETYVEGLLADKAGDYEKAVQRYRQLESEPNVVYNIADLYRRMEEPARAIEYYKKYLAAVPNATDRAVVTKLVAQLAATPQVIVVDGDDLDAVVFVDGKAVGQSPYVGTLSTGPHVIDRIGPASFGSRTVDAKPLDHDHIRIHNEATGNVAMSTPLHYGGSWTDGDKTFQMHGRFGLPPGRIDTYFFQPGRACSPVSFVVPSDGLVYVYIDAPRDVKKDRCTPIQVTAQKLAFPKVTP